MTFAAAALWSIAFWLAVVVGIGNVIW